MYKVVGILRINPLLAGINERSHFVGLFGFATDAFYSLCWIH